MINRARFRDYKLLRSAELEFDRFTVIVGANSSGKSTILEGLHHLLQLGSSSHKADGSPGGRFAAFFRGDRSPAQLCSRPDADSFEIEVEFDREQDFGVRVPKDLGKEEGHFWYREEKLKSSVTDRWEIEKYFAMAKEDRLSSVLRARLDAGALAREHYSEKSPPRIEHNGAGLASVLQYLHGLRDGTIEEIEQNLAKVVPGVRRIRILPTKVRREERSKITIDGQDSWVPRQREFTGATFEIEWEKIGWIPARQISEGTVLVLGLITMLRFNTPRLILLDDLDRGLHPTAQRELVALLKGVLRENPNLQVIATSHSPFVLNELEPDQMLIAARGDDGRSEVRKLKDHPDWKSQSDYLKPGEFWSAVGEKWVTEPRP